MPIEFKIAGVLMFATLIVFLNCEYRAQRKVLTREQRELQEEEIENERGAW